MLSPNEEEYMAYTHSCEEAIHLKNLCCDVSYDVRKIVIFHDYQSAICLVKDPTFHTKTKYIELKYYYAHDIVEDRKVNLEMVGTQENVVDTLT